MTSINTNDSAMAALQTLRSINSNLQDTQNAVSTGYRISKASDNAAYWSIATTMRSDNSALGAVFDAIGLGAAKVDTAYAAMDTSIDVVTQIKAKLVAATEEGIDKSKVQDEISQLQDQLKSVSQSASFSGENWLQADLGSSTASVTRTVVGSFVRDQAGNVSVKTIGYTQDSSSVLFDTSNSVDKYGILDAEDRLDTGPQTLGSMQVFFTSTTGQVQTEDFNVPIASALWLKGDGFSVDNEKGVATKSDGAVYLQIADDAWVEGTTARGTRTDGAGFTGKENVRAVIDGSSYYVVFAGEPKPSNYIDLEFSVESLDVTKLDDYAKSSGMSSNDVMAEMISFVDRQLGTMTSAASNLGSVSSRIDLQTNFVSSLSDSMTSGVGKLVDADMEEESSKLSALQTQQQLAVQSLSIANSSSQSILSLFR